MPLKTTPIVLKPIDDSIFLIRGQRVILDAALAVLYDVPLKQLNQAVRRNRSRLPDDFMFLLTPDDLHTITLDTSNTSLRSKIVTSKADRGGRRYLPYAFTEQGVAMLFSVLRSRRAIAVNIEIGFRVEGRA
jgi:ORF6N domain-containing protein